MGKYRVMVKRENFWMRVDRKPQRLGFYTTRFVEAASIEEAKQRGIRLVREDPKLAGMGLNERSDPPIICVEEIEGVASFDSVASSPTGLRSIQRLRRARPDW